MNNVSNKQTFRIRQYGRTELAQLYFPHLTPQAAWRKLRSWLIINPQLRNYVCSLSDCGRGRTFTPKQVGVITEELGEP